MIVGALLFILCLPTWKTTDKLLQHFKNGGFFFEEHAFKH